PAWLAEARAQARAALAQAAFPGRQSESWKYSRTTALEQSGVLAQIAPASNARVPASAAPVLDGWRAVFVNGRLDAAQSRLPTDGSLMVSPLSTLPAAEQAAALALLARADDSQLPFSLLNRAAFSDGLFVRVAKNAAI